MKSFLAAHRPEIKGTLSGLDRIRLRGTLRLIANQRAMEAHLGVIRILLKNFREWALGLTEQVRRATQAIAEAAGRPIVYLHSSQTNKEDVAREIANRDKIAEGLICVLTCIEPCRTFEVGPNRVRKLLELRMIPGKCLHQYFYLQHPRWGFMHLRAQTWLPFTLHVCLNGREWLAHQMRRARLGYVQRDNCFVDLSNPVRAQQLFDQQLRINWPQALGELVQEFHPAHATMFGMRRPEYYWSAEQTEWATDIMFRSPEALAEIYPRLVRHAMTNLNCEDVLRFFGRPAPQHRYYAARLQADLKRRHEGVRCKHQMNRNSIKMYDKQATVLRVETTLNDPGGIKVYRTRETDPEGQPEWLSLRKGIADLHRQTEVSQKANERYLESMASIEAAEPLTETVRDICQPTTWQGRRVRGFAPFTTADAALLAAVMRGEFALNGFRNRDLRAALLGDTPEDRRELKRQSAKITRALRLLRGHRLIQKVSHTNRYQLTVGGRRKDHSHPRREKNASTKKLTELAA